MKEVKIFSFIVVACFILIPFAIGAISVDENYDTEVINNINVSVNTGSNLSEGEVIEGETKTNIEIENIINGTSIDPIKIESDANEVSVKSEIKVKDNKAEVQREIETDFEKDSESYELDLESSEMENEEAGKISLALFQEWLSGVFYTLKSLFLKIFRIA